MRRSVQILAALSVLFVFVLIGQAGEGDAAAIINKAIKAHYPKGLDTKNQGSRTKAKGTLHVQGLDLEFTQEVSVQAPAKFKEVMELTVMDKKITVTTVFNGKDGWIRAGDKDVEVTEEILNELKDAAYQINLMRGVFLKDKTVKFSLIGEVQVKGKTAVGVTASRDGKKDINVFFDKKTGLIVKTESRKRDLMSGQEVTEERFITEYQDLNGEKAAKKVEVQRDGKALLEAEVLEVQILQKLDDGEFVQPK
jgi:hypothetical protein